MAENKIYEIGNGFVSESELVVSETSSYLDAFSARKYVSMKCFEFDRASLPLSRVDCKQPTGLLGYKYSKQVP